MKGFRKLTDEDRANILALKGQIVSRDVATRYGISSQTVYGIWQGRLIQRAMTKRKKRLTDKDRDLIITMKADGANIRQMVEASGFGDSTVLLVIREARAEGDRRLIPSAVVADTAGAGVSKSPVSSPAPAFPPRMMVKLNDTVRRMRDSLRAKGMAPDLALREALRIYAGSAVDARGGSRAAGGGEVRSFHAQNMTESGR